MTRCYWVPTAARGSWDQAICEELTEGFDHDPTMFSSEGAVVVLAGQHSLQGAELLVAQIAKLSWSLTIVTSDEEALFPVDLLPHDESHAIWGQYHARPEFDRVIPIGAAPGTLETVAPFLGQPRTLSVAFAGQATHARRTELVDTIKGMATDVARYGDIGWAATTGFREGLSQDRYLDMLVRTRIAPCPSGPHSLDSFRLYEALVAGCLPIVETHTPHGPEPGFWDALFGDDHPLLTVTGWDMLPLAAMTYRDVNEWEAERDRVRAWWNQWRAQLSLDFRATIQRLENHAQ